MYLVVILVSAFRLVQSNYNSLEKNKELKTIFLETQLQLKMEELKFLRMQLHPHFLFNTLNTLYGFALKKSDETPEMILKLSNLLDYILYQIEKPHVLLSEEINHIKDYIDLEKIRFSNVLNINISEIELNNDAKIAPMLLMPFVENSFKHARMIDGAIHIYKEVKTNGNELLFRINNSILSKQISGSGIGLENIKKRLELLYPLKHELTIQTKENEYLVQLKITIDE
jgi:LytS/YehU family sensor histidine kinase